MRDIDVKSLFDIFDTTSEEDIEMVSSYGLDDVGMETYHHLHSLYTKRYPKPYNNLSSEIRSKVYSKLYSLSERIDIQSLPQCLDNFNQLEINNIISIFGNMIDYYIGLEEYEKCHVLKSYSDLIQKK